MSTVAEVALAGWLGGARLAGQATGWLRGWAGDGGSGSSGNQQQGDQSMADDLFQFQVPPLEKVVRTVAIFVVIAILLRLVGKRTLAQLNAFDLVVMLLLSNVVQNAIIGDDNSLVGGVLGAAVLMATNWCLDRLAYAFPIVDRIANGKDVVLVRDGVLDEKALRKAKVRRHELLNAIRHQGADGVDELRKVTLESTGEFTVELMRHEQAASKGELDAAVHELRSVVDGRFAALEDQLRRLPGGSALPSTAATDPGVLPRAQHASNDPRRLP